jgi:hypothetical protein
MELAISVRDACPNERDRILRDYWASRIDPAGLRDRLESIWRAVRPLRWAGSVQWIVMFVVAPTVLSRYGGPPILLALAGSIFGLAAINAVLFARIHRQLCPDERLKRAESTILMLLSWPMAARASDIAARHSLARFDPTAALLAMPEVEASRFLLHRVIRDARHPLAAERLDPLTRDTSDRFASLWLDRVLRSAKRLGVQIPDPAEGAGVGNHTRLHCPRCLSTYEHDASTCNDCPGVRLEPTGRTEGA